MAAVLFDDILSKGIRAGHIPAKEQSARKWYRDTAEKFRLSSTRLLKSDPERLTNKIQVGSMYLYNYDPKFKQTLPYYDIFPLVFPFKKLKDGFLGINLHYLPLKHRAVLMDALYDLANNQKFDESTRLRMNYNLLNGAAKYRFFKPTIKHYLFNHVKSRLFYIYPAEWDIAMFLPLSSFKKGGRAMAWKDSRQMFTS